MFCVNCGNQIDEDSRFCEYCGAPVAFQGGPPQEFASKGQPPEERFSKEQLPIPNDSVGRSGAYGEPGAGPSPNIRYCPDGFYRWYYELNMFGNPVILFTIWKVMGIAVGITFLIVALIVLITGGIGDIFGIFRGFSIGGLLFVFILGTLGYVITAALYGGKYVVLFEMNDEEVRHIQQPKQFKKAQAVAWLSLFTSAATGDLGGAGRSMAIMNKDASIVRFAAVKGVKVLRNHNTIKLNEALEHSQVYAKPEDFDFVLDYIMSRVPEQAGGRV